MQMRVAGIAWTGRGFEVALADESGEPAAPLVRIPAGQVGALTEHLLTLDRSGDQPLVCVVESTNGMVDGGLMAAGLRVHRADPWHLPDRPAFGSVDAGTLARTGATRLPELPRLVLEEGSLTGRSADHASGIAASEAELAALTAAGQCLAHGDRERHGKTIALTFDDGPNPPYTGRILDVLERYGVPATFFCVGLHASAHTEELARMTEAGHGLANHTWSHPFLGDLSPQELVVQLERTDEAIATATGVEGGRRKFRPPYGSRTPEILDRLAADDDTTVVLWDVDTEDWAMPGSDVITRNVLTQARPGSIALMHDGGGDRSQTAEALPAIIEGLLADDYRFALVDDLLG
jgi:peptidoglycan/xylan/chitin deacetylase (PgdA/CDA1 family)